MFIGYGTQAMQALQALARIDEGAHLIALLRIQAKLISLDGDGVVDTTVEFSLDDNKFVVSFIVAMTGVEATIAELDWQVNGV
ncbi:hypothetical protein [Streptomyces sp. NPDC101455]|uniref:hypothetical protein n=1 Tax=Streptomyces sp. NPDC101455 TaxID=3366142 RepID=UPI0038010704